MEQHGAEVGLIGAAMRQRTVKLSEEEWEAKLREISPGEFGGDTKSGDWETWSPTDKAGHKPKPLLLQPNIKDPNNPTWSDYLTPETQGRNLFILGAGESALQFAKYFDNELVYGINWTPKWFMPTFLQIMDAKVYEAMVNTATRRWSEPKTQLVISKWLSRNHPCNAKSHLLWNMIHPALKKNRDTQRFAETPDETTWWAPNSLYPALNIAHWFKPRRIILVGFDMGGRHFFGDGRAVGAAGRYLAQKDGLGDRLRYIRDELEKRGNIIRQVGETSMDIFKHCDTMEEALDG